MFRDLLAKTIRSDINAAIQSETILEAAKISAPEDVSWESLTAPQRDARRVKRFASSLDRLSELDCASLLAPKAPVTPEVVGIVSRLVSLDKPNATNPTRLELLNSVAQTIQEGRPLEMFASLCLEKGPGLRDGKLNWFLNGQAGETPRTLATEASIKGWATVKRILDTIDYPVYVRFLLGDLDYAVVDGCSSWCKPGWEEVLTKDTDRIVEETQERADQFFGNERNVRIMKWSSLYKVEEVLSQLPRAEALISPEQSPQIIKGSFEIYKRQWGYSALARRMGIDEGTLDTFIIGDVQRMAAQYRVEANYVQLYNGIQLWCEASPNPGWPIALSNFNRAGYVASLIME
jgi:hypothetical protein